MNEQKKKIQYEDVLSTADAATATEQMSIFLVKGYGTIKWLLKSLVAKGMIRLFDYAKTWAQFYAAFTKRSDTLGIFISKLTEYGYDLCITLALDTDPTSRSKVDKIRKNLKGFNEFTASNVLPLANDKMKKPRDIWFLLEAVLNLPRELEAKGISEYGMGSMQFRLRFYEYTSRCQKLPWVDEMIKDLNDLDKRLGRREAKNNRGRIETPIQKQQDIIYYPNNISEENMAYPAQGSYPYKYSRNDTPRYPQPHYSGRGGYPNRQHHPHRPYPYHKPRGGRRGGTGRGPRGYRDDRNRRRSRSRSRSRSRDRGKREERRESRVKPDFAEGYDSNWDKKKAVYEYKEGKMYGKASLEGRICRHFNELKCTYGNKRCKWHHMCKFCLIIGEHASKDCPNKRDMMI